VTARPGIAWASLQRRPWHGTPIGHQFRRRPGRERVPGWVRGSLGPAQIRMCRSDLRCLVCLRHSTSFDPPVDVEWPKANDFRQDQVCKACEKAWARSGRPVELAFPGFVTLRRTEYLKSQAKWPKDRPKDHLAALDRIANSPSVRAAPENPWPVTRANDNGVIWNGYCVGISRRLALGLSVPYGWRRHHDDRCLLVPELTLEMWRAAQPRRHLQPLPSCPSEPLAPIINIATRKSVASSS
jgi:hypothetical protein